MKWLLIAVGAVGTTLVALALAVYPPNPFDRVPTPALPPARTTVSDGVLYACSADAVEIDYPFTDRPVTEARGLPLPFYKLHIGDARTGCGDQLDFSWLDGAINVLFWIGIVSGLLVWRRRRPQRA